MKILFYCLYDANKITILRHNCDYMVDCLFHGLRSLLGPDCIDYTMMPQWYNTVDKSKLYGNGFTAYGLCEEINVDREDLDLKIKNKFFDQIIVGIHNNRYNCSDNINIIKKLIGPKNNNVKVICGNDDSKIDYGIAQIVPFFKRELYTYHHNVYPISFCVPKEKIINEIPNKTKVLSDIKPNHQGESGWKIINEQNYYQEYINSIFAITYKKGGWDCMRHYEILMNGCIPLFTDIENCPKNTLTFLPKDFLLYILKQRNNFEPSCLEHVINFLLEYTKKNLTTESMAKYVLDIV